jgi:hypothetical protein
MFLVIASGWDSERMLEAATGDTSAASDLLATRRLGFLKRKANFDDPDSYHFYLGDDLGLPGSNLPLILEAWTAQ